MPIFPDPDEGTQRLLDDLNRRPSNGVLPDPNDEEPEGKGILVYIVAAVLFAAIALGALLRGCGLPDF